MNFIDALAYYLLSIAVLVAVAIARPSRARCPPGWWLDEGVRLSGDFVCVPNAPEQYERTPRGGWRDVSVQPAGELRSRVYCTGGARPITVDGVDVGCQPGGYR